MSETLLRIRKVFEKSGKTQTEIGKLISKTSQYVWKLLNDDKANPSDSVIKDICREFNVNEEWLKTGEGGEGNMYIDVSPYENAYNRFGYIMENSSPSKKAALTMLLELLYEVPDDKWELIMKQFEEIKGEG